MPEVENDRIVRTTQEARAGETGDGVRYMLVAGTVGVAVLFVGVYLYFFA
jgi:hypothetical protein